MLRVLVQSRYPLRSTKRVTQLLETHQQRKMSSVVTKDSPEIYEYPPSKPNTVLNIAQRAQIHVIERFGRFHRTCTSELYFAMPLVDQIVAVVDEREMVLQISPQHAITKDNVTIHLRFVYFILFYFILFYFILFYFILFYFILFYFILFYFILFY